MSTENIKRELGIIASAILEYAHNGSLYSSSQLEDIMSRYLYNDEVKEEPPHLLIRPHKELYPNLPDVVKYGNFIDLYNAEQVILKAGEYKMISLGVSVQCPEGYWLQIVPRSSTFKKYHIIQTNSFGVVDTEFCGDNDILGLPVYATEDTVIPANERICQFRLVKDIPFDISYVNKLNNPDRGGLGSTGRK